MIKELFKWFNRRKQSEEIGVNDTRLYRFTAGDHDQLHIDDIKQYKELIETTATKAIKHLDKVIAEKEKSN